MVVCGWNVTVLCGLGEEEVEDVGGGSRGDVSVEAEAMAGTTIIYEALICDTLYVYNDKDDNDYDILDLAFLCIFVDWSRQNLVSS